MFTGMCIELASGCCGSEVQTLGHDCLPAQTQATTELGNADIAELCAQQSLRGNKATLCAARSARQEVRIMAAHGRIWGCAPVKIGKRTDCPTVPRFYARDLLKIPLQDATSHD